MKNLIFLTTSSLIEKFASFVLYSLLAYNFGKESLGYFSYYFIIANILYLLLDFGGNVYEVKFFTHESYMENAINVFFVKIFAYSIFAPFIFFFIDDIFFIIFYCSFFLESLFTIIKSSLFCKKEFSKFSYYMIMEKMILIIIAVTGAFAIKNLLIFYFALLISKAITLAVIFFKEPEGRAVFLLSNLSLQKMKLYISDSWSYTFYSFFALVYGRVGVLIMKNITPGSIGDIGIYSSYANIIMSSLIIPEIFFKSYYPGITKDFFIKNFSSMYEKIDSVLKISLISSFFVALFISAFAKEISSILFGSDFSTACILLSILTIKIIFRYSLRPYLAVVASSDFTKFRFYISFVVFFFSIVINYILIFYFGLNGLVGSVLLVELVLFLSYRIFCQKNIIKKSFFKHDLFLILEIAAVVLFAFFFNNTSLLFRALIFMPVILLTLLMLFKEKNNFIFRRE